MHILSYRHITGHDLMLHDMITLPRFSINYIPMDDDVLLNEGDRDIIDGDYINISSDDNRFKLSTDVTIDALY